jgi:hypothetical protein
VRDGIRSGFSLISRRNHDLSIFSTAVIYPVVKVHRRSGSATEAGLPALQLSAGRWAPAEHTDQRTSPGVLDTRRRLEDQSCEPSKLSRRGTRRSSRGWDPSYLIALREDLVQGNSGLRQGGGDEETRTPDPLLAKEMLFQLSYVPVLVGGAEVVGVSGLEPETSALSGQRSNQLS